MSRGRLEGHPNQRRVPKSFGPWECDWVVDGLDHGQSTPKMITYTFMFGVIAGDVIGSRFERAPIKTIDFSLFHPLCSFTDDTVLTVATASAILRGAPFDETYLDFGRRYPDAAMAATSTSGSRPLTRGRTTATATARRCGLPRSAGPARMSRVCCARRSGALR